MNIFENTFENGLNSDIDVKRQPQGTYRDAKNIEITGLGKFLTATNMRGNTKIADLIANTSISNNYYILGAFDVTVADYNNSTSPTATPSLVKALIVFCKLNGSSKVFYITTNDGNFSTGSNKYDLTSVEYTGDLAFPDYGEMDAVVLGEKEHSNIYFTDNTNNLRKITCIIRDTNGRAGASGTAGSSFYWNKNEVAISLFRHFPQDKLSIYTVEMGGNLLSGGYQISYRYWDAQRNKYSTVAPFPNIVPIYPQDYSSITNKEHIFGGILNEQTPKKIKLQVDHKAINVSNYTHIQLVAIKWIDGTTAIPSNAYITEPIPISNTSSDNTAYYDYTGLNRESEVTLSSIVVDNADINTCKTVTIKDNIMFIGNIQYFNRQTPSIDPTGLTITEVTASLGNNGIFDPSVANSTKGSISNSNCKNVLFGTDATAADTRIATDAAQIIFNTQDSCATGGSEISPPLYCNNTRGSGAQTFSLSGFVAGNIITLTIDYMFDGLAAQTSGSSDYVYATCHTDLRNYAPTISYVVQEGDTSDSIIDAIVNKFKENKTTQQLDFNNYGGLLQTFYYDPQSDSHADCCGDRVYKSFLILRFSSDFGVKYGIDTSKTGNGGYKNPLNTTNSRGYFRDEVYAFGKVYVDKYGNWSTPQRYDFSTKQRARSWGGIDWKFSSREDKPIFDTNDSIQALGLRIHENASVNPHPDWAVGMLIVRGKRIKNILYQSPHIPIIGAMPNNKDYSGTINDDKASDGSWLPKKFSTGASRNLLRLDSFTTNTNNLYGLSLQDLILNQNMPLSGSVISPPEYIFNKNGTSYYTNVNLSGATLRMVDAAAFWMTPQFITRTSASPGYPSGLDFGNINVSSNGMAFRADSRANYYWNLSYGWKTGLDTLFAASNYFPANGQSSIVNQYYAVRGTTYVTLYEYLAGTNTKMSKIIKYNDMDTVSLANRGQDANGQRSILVTLQDVFGDAMFVTANPSVPVGNPANPTYLESLLKFGNSADDKWFPYYWSVPTGAPAGTGYDEYRKTRFNDRTWDNILMTPYVVDDPTTPTEYYGIHAVCPIVNVELGLPDTRYGDINAPIEFVSTGAYIPITSTSQNIDVSVFGGDCFVSKYYYKVNDTQLGVFSSDVIPSPQDYTDGSTQDNYVQAVTDCAEVLGVYIESEINTELPSDRLTYPVPTQEALSNYNTIFTYEYIFGYSAQNYVKSWFTKNQSTQLQSSLPARICISDQKIYQGNIEGFDTFRAASYYDMEETFGGITKLVRNFNNRVICLQEKAVSDLQVGLRLLTDGAGNENVTYSTTLIDKPQFILTTAGCQNLKTVKQSDDSVFFADGRLGKVYKIGGDGGQISDAGVYSVFVQDLFNGFADVTNSTTNANLVGVYDFVNGTYTVGNNKQSDLGQPVAYIFSEKAGFKWVGTIYQDQNDGTTKTKNARFLDLAFSNQNIYMIGRTLFHNTNQTDIRVEKMYDPSAVPCRMLGQMNKSTVQFVVNPMNGYENVYNVFAIDSNARCDSVTFTTTKDNNTYLQSITQSLSSVTPRQTLYELTIVRDSNGRKLRSPYVLAEITLSPVAFNESTANNLVSVNKLFTKFVYSPRQI